MLCDLYFSKVDCRTRIGQERNEPVAVHIALWRGRLWDLRAWFRVCAAQVQQIGHGNRGGCECENLVVPKPISSQCQFVGAAHLWAVG